LRLSSIYVIQILTSTGSLKTAYIEEWQLFRYAFYFDWKQSWRISRTNCISCKIVRRRRSLCHCCRCYAIKRLSFNSFFELSKLSNVYYVHHTGWYGRTQFIIFWQSVVHAINYEYIGKIRHNYVEYTFAKKFVICGFYGFALDKTKICYFFPPEQMRKN